MGVRGRAECSAREAMPSAGEADAILVDTGWRPATPTPPSPFQGEGVRASRSELPSQILETLRRDIDLLARRRLAAAGAVLVGARDVAGA